MRLAEERKFMGAFLFVHFREKASPDGEQIYFALSKDGFHWEAVNGGEPVLWAYYGDKGVRDATICRSCLDKKFYIMATDLSLAYGMGDKYHHSWEEISRNGSKALAIWESEDLLHWTEQSLIDFGNEDFGCMWAPDILFDPERQEYMVHWSSSHSENNYGPKTIYYSYTKDFHTFTDPRVLYRKEDSQVIDSAIYEEDGTYYMFVKSAENPQKIILLKAAHASGSYEIVPAFDKSMESVEAGMYEAPTAVRLGDGRWGLFLDYYGVDGAGQGYVPFVADSLKEANFVRSEQEFSFPYGFKHGTILSITEEEYEKIRNFNWEQGKMNPVLSGLYADPDIAVFDGKTYIYPTTDGFKGWDGKQFFVFSSEDGVHFRKGSMILDVASEQVPWAVSHAWAPCIAEREGKYYFYFCAKNAEGNSCIGMAFSDTPEGPFQAMREPLITMELIRKNGLQMGQTIDPSIYVEDGEYYLLFGNGYPAIVQLADSMDSIVPGTMRNLEGLTDFREAVTVLKRRGIYHFTWSCDDTGSEDYHVNYGISDSLYGPVDFQYTILKKDPSRDILGTGHHSIIRIPGKDEYRIAYHRFGTPLKRYPKEKGYYRETCIAKLEFGEDELMRPVKMLD